MTSGSPPQILPGTPPAERLEPLDRRCPAVVLAGDRSHSRAVDGRSKAFVAVGGQPMILHVLEALLDTPEISEIFVVGDPQRLEQCFATSDVLERAARSSRAVRIVPQGETLYENVWRGFLRSAAASGPPDPDHRILCVPADIPLVIPEEISDFVAKGMAVGADYVLGLTPDVALEPFAPREGQPGIAMACFNLREGRFRQNNLHMVRPLRIANRHYIEDMYESRHQRELRSMIWLGLQVVFREIRHLWVLGPYLALHLAGLLDRRGFARSARLARHLVSIPIVERASCLLLRTRFATAVTVFGGAALDIDNEIDCEVADKMFAAWKKAQLEHGSRAMLCARGS